MANELIGLVNKTTGAGVADAKTIVKDGEVTASSYGNLLSTADTTVQLVADRMNAHQHNVGIKALGLITANGDGTIDIASTTAWLHTGTDFTGLLAAYTIPAATDVALTADSVNYIIADYNAGTPQYSAITNPTLINGSSKVLVANIYKEGTGVSSDLHIIDVDFAKATATRLLNRLLQQQRFVRISGLGLAESAGRHIDVGSGVVYYGIRNFALGPVASDTDEAALWYHSSSAWAKTAITAYNNTQFDNGTDLVELAVAGPNASTWARSGTTVTVTFAGHLLTDGDTIEVTVSSDVRPVQLGSYVITKTGADTFTIVGRNRNDTSGTLTYTTATRYAVNWIYRFIETVDKHIAVNLGTANYTLTEAVNSQPPTPPTILGRQAILVGRIIVAKGGSTAYQIDSSFVTTYETEPVKDHNDLADLQGGAANEYFHLNSAGYECAKYITSAQSLTASATISAGNVKFTGSTASQTLTLPLGVEPRLIRIRNAASVAVTIARDGSDTIEGETTLVLNPGESVSLTFIGTDWTIF